jgi:ankyrin repeat protein
VYAERALTTIELCHALAVEIGTRSMDGDNIMDVEEVVSVCAGLVTVDEESDIIRLVHYTTQDYFERNRETWSPQGQLQIARTCLTYLSYDDFRQDLNTENLIGQCCEEHPLLEYAARYWTDHARTVQLEVFDLAYSLLLDNALITNFARVVYEWLFFNLIEDERSHYTGTALHVLASFGLLYMAKEVHTRFRSDFDSWINKENDSGHTCLFWAVRFNNEPMTRLLLDKGADVNVFHRARGERRPLLWLAIESANLEIVQLMIDRGADLHLLSQDEGMYDNSSAILVAAHVGHLGIIQLLLDNGADLSIVSSRKRYTALHLAARKGHLDAVRFLLDKGADADSPDNKGRTAMHAAAMFGHASIVAILLDWGVVASLLDDEGRAAIHIAAEEGDMDIVHLLLARGADLDLPTGDGETAVYLAAQSREYMVVKLLLENNADPNLSNDKGRAAIHIAAESGYRKIVQLLLNKGADPNVANQGTTAIALGSSQGFIEVVQLLLQGGANPNLTNDETAIFKATRSRYSKVVQLLLEGGADPNLPTSNGWTPLHIAANGGYLKIVRLLLDKGVDFDAVDKEAGSTAVYRAAQHGYVEITRILLEKGANPNLPAVGGWAPIHVAAQQGYSEVVRLLLEKGVYPDLPINDGWTPLHIATSRGHLSIVELLMRRGADVLATTHRGDTPLTVAAWYGHAEIVDLLIPSCPDWREIITPEGSLPAIVARRGYVTMLKHLHEKYDLDLQAFDAQNRYLLHIAARYGQSAIISFLVDQGISALTKDAKGDNILCYAASSGSLETVNKALEVIPEPWTTHEGFWSPFHWACRAGKKEIVERLMEAGYQSTKVTLAQPEGEWTPMDVAILHGHAKMLQELSENCRTALGPLKTTIKNGGELVGRWISSSQERGDRISCDACGLHVSRVWNLSCMY